MKRSILALVAVTTLFFGACKKDNDNNNNPGGDNTYQPFSNGSVWKYRNTIKLDAETIVDTTTNTMTAATKTLNGKLYHVQASVDATDTTESYLGLNNDVYSMFYDAGEDLELEVGYLNDKKAAGESWVVATTIEDDGEEIEAQLKTTIVEKGINKTILDKPYSNVIHSKVELQAKVGGAFVTVTTLEFYVAKGVGVIAIYGKNDTNVETLKSELFSSTIK